MLVAVPVILLLLAIAIPNFIPPHTTLSTNACANNLRWLQEAKAKWARDLSQPDTAVPTESDLLPVLKALGAGDFSPQCPSGGTYIIGAVTEPPKCSIREPGHALPTH
ncbi:MAG TPA: hypothetical protein VLT36_10170 [Candidatus Dormibacteraeota bacterium]|nr:hypothetical protein [Candidatus Dormibacteraeota bacterium]